MNTVKVAVHESKNSEKIVAFLELNQFSYEFQDAYNNGFIYGVYQTRSGKVRATTNDGETIKNVLA